ncbi:hypothetical protein SMC26_40300 [Actinomadura fulvescens]|uniref:Major tail protein n=1 Tax=Actinomadura fulvescens TaxID=46160 RepID=A0ABN3Q6Q0_9ACTN
MALDASKVRVAVTGALYVAAPTATAPTNSTSPVPSGYADAGFLNEDGLTESYDEDTNEVRAWQNGQIVRTLTSSSNATLAFTMIETKRTSLELYHKGSTITSIAGGYQLDVKPPTPDPRRFILDVLDGTLVTRLYVPNGEVTERGEITYVNDEVISYNVTITCYPVAGVVLTKFGNDPNWGYS